MNAKKILCVAVLALSSTFSFSQSSIWYFGTNGGLRFLPNGLTTPQPGSAMTTNEGCTGATDNSGNLLFYADGLKLWHGGNNTQITGSMLGHWSSTQAALIVPLPGNFCTKFLVFTTEAGEDVGPNFDGVGVSLVTVTGAPPPAHTVIYDPAVSIMNNNLRFSEKLAATSDGNGGWWVVAHTFSTTAGVGGDQFYKFHITNTANFTGLTTSAGARTELLANLSIQTIGIPHRTPSGPNYNAQGQMKFSKDGTHLGLVLAGDRDAETYFFNTTNGTITVDKYFDINGNGNTYGFEFSPNNQLIYVSEGWNAAAATRNLYQYDLTQTPPILPTVISSITAGGGSGIYPFNALQLGPNDKIYVDAPGINQTSLSVIDNPDISGLGCNYTANSVPISGTTMHGLPTVISSLVSCDPVSTTDCNCDGVLATLNSLNLLDAAGNADVSFTLSSGGMQVSKIRITLLNYLMIPNNASCKNYCNMTNTDFGHFVMPFNTIPGFTATPSPFNVSTSPVYTNDIVMTTSAPQTIVNQTIQFRMKFPPILALSCCSQTINACFRIEFIDADCKICDVMVCNTGGDHSDKSLDNNNQIENIDVANRKLQDMDSQLSVYPNPNNGNFTINTSKIGSPCKFELYDTNSKKIMTGEIEGELYEINKQDLASGVYFLYVFNQNRVFTEKIVVGSLR